MAPRFVELEQPQRELKSAVDLPILYFPILVNPFASSVVCQLNFNSWNALSRRPARLPAGK